MPGPAPLAKACATPTSPVKGHPMQTAPSTDTIELFDHLLRAWATQEGPEADRAALLAMAERTVEAIPVAQLCAVVTTSKAGASTYRKDGALPLACKSGPASLVVRVLHRMARETGWENDLGPYARRGPQRADLRLLKRADEGEAISLWDAAAPLLQAGHIETIDTPWKLLCGAFALGWMGLAARMETFHTANGTLGAAKGSPWRNALSEMRQHPRATQRHALGILARMIADPRSAPPDATNWQMMDLCDAMLLLRLRPSWAASLHDAGVLAQSIKRGDAFGEDRQALAHAVSTAHGRLAVAAWDWPVERMLGSLEEAQRAARALVGIAPPQDRKRARKMERMAARGRTVGPKGGTRHPGNTPPV